MAGAIIKYLFLLGLFAVILGYAFMMRAIFGYTADAFLQAMGLNASQAFTPEELQWLSTGDMIYKALPAVGFITLTAALAIEIYRKSTEGQRYQL